MEGDVVCWDCGTMFDPDSNFREDEDGDALIICPDCDSNNIGTPDEDD